MEKLTSSEDLSKELLSPMIKSKRRYPMYVFYVLLAVSLLNQLDRTLFDGAANIIAKELHLGVSSIGYLSTAFTIFVTLAALPMGIFADRTKRKNVITACLAVWSLATAFTALAGNFATLFLTRTVVGIGEAGYAPASHALLGSHFASSKRTRIMTWYSLGGLVGGALGVILGGVVAGLSYGSWRLAFFITGLLGLLLVVVTWRLRESPPNQPDRGSGEYHLSVKKSETGVQKLPKTLFALKQVLAPFWTLLHIRTLVVLIVIQTLASFAITGFRIYFPTLLQQKDVLGWSSAQAAVFTGLTLLPAAIAGILLGGYLSDWLNRRYRGALVFVCGVSLLLSATFMSIVLLVLLSLHSVLLFATFFALLVMAFSMSTGPATAATLDVVPASLRASAVAFTALLQYFLGAAFAPTLVGSLASAFDPTGQHFLHGMAGHDLVLAFFTVAPAAFLIAGIVGLVGSRWMEADQEAAQRADEATIEIDTLADQQGA